MNERMNGQESKEVPLHQLLHMPCYLRQRRPKLPALDNMKRMKYQSSSTEEQ